MKLVQKTSCGIIIGHVHLSTLLVQFTLPACVCVCFRVHICECMFTRLYIGQWLMSGIFLGHFLTYFLRQSLIGAH